MKVIIHYQEDITKTVNFMVSKLSNLKAIIDIYPDEDITGEIRPSAKNNPELNDILLAIYDHKFVKIDAEINGLKMGYVSLATYIV